ncbi:TPM domain-containing protein [Vulcaniibacterium tengchongense]|uniref:TLP18.3/Psb32/MOLO-1 phosphatase superfamily protein n=1 Tax=Vulcaniibacterium tengchongense TaxID=1273429 RepID=A0A3N4UZB0_9GAMM|nr:TPM domain-containing protein [Vulcaniibacterium tengchongense]RPE75478.1 TLP18.3/Psb32/MOLO-1 phosphatase superfamily protein [Vulcaniibacterium tengchongense]
MIQRLLRHLFPPSAQRLFPAASLQRIAAAIADSELRHRGEICFAVEPALPPLAVLRGADARARAHEVFVQLRVWDTEANNGVLLYLLLADHRIEIVADRGFAGKVDDEQWRGVCHLIEERLREGEPEAAVLRGVEALSALLTLHFPRAGDDRDVNELPDRPHLL